TSPNLPVRTSLASRLHIAEMPVAGSGGGVVVEDKCNASRKPVLLRTDEVADAAALFGAADEGQAAPPNRLQLCYRRVLSVPDGMCRTEGNVEKAESEIEPGQGSAEGAHPRDDNQGRHQGLRG